MFSGGSGNRLSGIVEEMSRRHAVVLVVIALTTIVVDAVVNAELRAIIDTTAGIFDLEVVDPLFEVFLWIPGE